MAKKFRTGGFGGAETYVATEDGKTFRGFRQDMEPVKRHVRFLNDKVNLAPKVGNKQDLNYIGSLTWPQIMEFCKQNGCTVDQMARNEDNLKAKLLAWFRSNEFSDFHANDSRA